ncbi:putative PEP-binding protein [Acaryochloris sp. CCMEE 5410]|uniref:putative PEP-binding protein n=1 Tax=Acaryochloris sp. CCMEE 5410 TaxID=310037 RepID=UPI0002484030|nr:putative PEP-binding protein [Acaryochloris sp. CCMEE 5410]KAI9134110.1 phosphoenolpyruvate synthase [Acaryochloris sp. CCMEE 5410]
MRSSVQDNFVESLYWLNKLETTHSLRVGDAALGLAELCNAQMPVLPSAVIGTESFQQFCRSIVWSSPFLSDFPHVSLRIRAAHPFQLQAVAEEIAQRFEQTDLPPLWLQTTSAELQGLSNRWRLCPSLTLPKPWTQFTPLLTEMLPVQYCSLTGIGTAIKQAWNSTFTAHTLLLMQERAIPIDQLRVALLLQPVTSAQASGFLTVTETHIQVQATHGLSKSLMMGEILPETYTYDRQEKRWHRYPGSITSAYQAPFETSIPGELGLVQQILTPVSDSWVLEQLQLEQLLDLAQKLPPLQSELQAVEWIFSGKESEELHIAGLRPAQPLPPLTAALQLRKEPELDDNSRVIAAGLAAAVGQVTAPILICEDPSQLQPHIVANQIVVLKQVGPADWIWLQKVAGLICTTGGHTSHGAIMARELGLPAVVGVAGALETFQSGQMVLLDGNHGQVLAAPSSSSLDKVSLSTPTKPAFDLDLKTTQLWVNLSQSQRLDRALHLPVHGVGLLRSEWFLLDICQGQLPDVWIQQQGADAFVSHLSHHLLSFAQAWHPRPVLYRSLDCKQDAAHSLQPANSILGLRGGAQYMYDSTLFDLELQALAKLCHQGCQNIRLILPFIRSVEEFIFCRDRLQVAHLLEHLQIWIMAEVPSVLFQLPEYVAAGVQGIAIGTNDLTQLILGVHRENTYLTERYAANHPAVVAALSQLVKTAKSLGIPCSICGQAPIQHPQLIPQFVEWGVTAISVDLSAVPTTQVAIATAEAQLKSRTAPSATSSTTQNG